MNKEQAILKMHKLCKERNSFYLNLEALLQAVKAVECKHDGSFNFYFRYDFEPQEYFSLVSGFNKDFVLHTRFLIQYGKFYCGNSILRCGEHETKVYSSTSARFFNMDDVIAFHKINSMKAVDDYELKIITDHNALCIQQ